MVRKIAGVLLLTFCAFIARPQINPPCTTLGQTPPAAFPVCGQQLFVQKTVPYCVNHPIPVPGCGPDYADVNPYWYKFTCYKSGTLGFVITPDNNLEDYDWQIFDVTGRDVNEVYTNPQLFVAGNWAGTLGLTGASNSGVYKVQCASMASEHISAFSSLPGLIEGHQYLLLVSHFTRAPNGYTLAFYGGTAVITDTTRPGLKSAEARCSGMSVTVVLNKKMRCESLAADGSDFTLHSGAAAVTGAQGINCSSGFDMDSVTVLLNKPLPPGKYTMSIKQGSDDNTLFDYCNNEIPAGDSVMFEVFPPQPTPFDSIVPVGCAPGVIQLSFKKGIQCNSVAADGTDFIVSGPANVKVTGANAVCSGGLGNIIEVHLQTPLLKAGTYHVSLVKGSDGNTLINECGEETPAAQVSFTAKEAVSASFDYRVSYGCNTDTIVSTPKNNNGITRWQWQFTGGYTSNAPTALALYSSYGEKNIKLSVSNGTCTDTAHATVTLDNYFKAAFTISSADLCPGDTELFTDSSTGTITAWQWNFGDGTTSSLQSPQKTFIPPTHDNTYNVRLIVQDNHHCFDTAYQPVKVIYTCYIAVPTAFTPNGDNLNDYLYPLNAYKTSNLEFKVFNRFGQLVFYTTDWTKKWDGTYKGKPQPEGSYVWVLRYTHTETRQQYYLKGTSVLIR